MSAILNPVQATSEAVLKRRAAFTFLLAVCWVLAALFLSRFLSRLLPVGVGALGQECLNALLFLAGLLVIGRRYVPELRPLSSVGLVRRPGQAREFGLGLATGWAVALALMLPGLLTMRMRSVVTWDRLHLGQALLGVAVIAANAFAVQLVVTGLAFRSLVRTTSTFGASLILAGVVALLTLYSRQGDLLSAVFTAAASLLFAMAALRTRAIWLPMGLHLGWALTISVLFGANSFLWPVVNGPVETSFGGPRWLTGNGLGPEASIFAFAVVGCALLLLWRATRDLAWNYAHDPVISAGYPMDVAPPPEHLRMEQEAARPPLVQIHGIDIAARPPE